MATAIEKEETRGAFCSTLFDLACQTLDFAQKYDLPITFPYESGVDWWKSCMFELLRHYFESSDRLSSGTFKKEMKANLAAWEAYQNPVSPADRKYPNLNQLLDTAMGIAKYQPKESNQLQKVRKDFRDFYWAKFLSAYKDFLQHQTQPYVTYPYLKEDSLYFRPTQKKKNVPTEIKVSSQPKGFKSGRGKKI